MVASTHCINEATSCQSHNEVGHINEVALISVFEKNKFKNTFSLINIQFSPYNEEPIN
jgi:hypothetical protein